MLMTFLRGSVIASFFFAVATPAFTWDGLPHSHQAQFNALIHQSMDRKISDPDFLYAPDTAPVATIFANNLLGYEKSKNDYVCQFPARSLFFAHLKNEPLSLSHCEDLSQFIDNVPSDTISLVYASENLLSASSFMGHSFLKLADREDNKAHGVSFFTDLDTINIPKLFVQTITQGKPGYLIVSPYQESRDFYINEEGRNLFEYQLALSDHQKKLVQYHLWELKGKNIPYFFNKHNCATMTQDILAIVAPELATNFSTWVSPLDVLKDVLDTDLVTHTQVLPSLNWRLRAYGKSLSSQSRTRIAEEVANGRVSSPDDLISLDYAQALNDAKWQSDDINEQVYKQNQQRFSEQQGEFNGQYIDLTAFKNPAHRADDSQYQLGFKHQADTTWLTASWMPLSHLLFDDHQNAFSESALTLLKLDAAISDNTLRLEQFTLYGFESYLPYKKGLTSYSGYFNVAWHNTQLGIQGSRRHVKIAGGAGVSFSPHSALTAYLTAGASINTNAKAVWLTPSLKAGVMAYLKHEIKLTQSIEYSYNPFNRSTPMFKSESTLTYLGLKHAGLDVFWGYQNYLKQSEHAFGLRYRKYY